MSADVTREPETWPPLRADLRGVEPYGAPQLDVPFALNVNENPYPPSQAVVDDITAAVAAVAPTLNRYPDREFTELRGGLAAYLTADAGFPVAPEQIWAANGSNEVMLQILQAFGGPGRKVVSFAPTYSMYPEYARDAMTTWVAGRRHEDFTFDLDEARRLVQEHQPSVILLPSPNNPTGTALPHDVIGELCALMDQPGAAGVVVIDEAYAEFRRAGTPSALELLPQHRNLIVTRTMSKAFALAGARLGYLAAAPELCDALRVVRLPYHLSAVTQAVAGAALRHADELLGRVDQLRVRARPHREVAGRTGSRSRAERRELRIVRSVPRSCGTLAGAARPRCADPHHRPGGLAAGLDRNNSGDDGVQGCPEGRPAGHTERCDMTSVTTEVAR